MRDMISEIFDSIEDNRAANRGNFNELSKSEK